jgi:hypothetical protein
MQKISKQSWQAKKPQTSLIENIRYFASVKEIMDQLAGQPLCMYSELFC